MVKNRQHWVFRNPVTLALMCSIGVLILYIPIAYAKGSPDGGGVGEGSATGGSVISIVSTIDNAKAIEEEKQQEKYKLDPSKLKAERTQLEQDKANLEKELAEVKEQLNKTVSELQEVKAVKEQAKATSKNIDNYDKDVALRTLTVVATAYTAYCNGCSGTTANGLDLRANPNSKVIAVDPRLIKLGSKVELLNNGVSMGVYTAADTGGAIKGHKIDIFMSSKSRALEWGRQTISLRVLN